VRDPFTDLRAPDAPVDPDPTFAAGLRARIERALALPRGVAAVNTTVSETTVAAPRSAAVPYLAVDDARRALDWYVDVFGAEIVGEPIVMPDGRIGHAELSVSGGAVYLADAHPEIGVTAPRPGESPVSLMLPVDDADEVRRRAMAAGAAGDREPYDGYGQRNAWIVDPFGHRWGLNSPLRAPHATPSGYRHGDVGYVSLRVPDVDDAVTFYADVLGWTVTGGQVDGATPATGFFGAAGRPNLFCCYAVDDVPAAVERIQAAGGTASEPHREPYGLVADCTDDQGTDFAVWEIEGGAGRPPANGRRSGDLAYLTLEVVDSSRAREFYGAVLGWRLRPGRIADGWQVEDTAPMIGLSGGHARATAVPMWRVSGVERAVGEVRSHGGTATDPERQPYGLTSECTDEQGMRFYLGEL
jgi:predicted enzyme related to lactoylglutathione lyase